MEKFKDNDHIDNVSLALKINEIIDWINNENLAKIAELKLLMEQKEVAGKIEQVFNQYAEVFKNGKH